MVMTAKLSISIVIPVYNEENQIKGCLDSIMSQTIMPDEIIVVDNNCRDKTIVIAKKYPLVRVVEEKNQGRGYARTTGFNAVKSDIAGRIDADSRLEPNWVETALHCFENDQELMGLTGMGKTSFIPGIQSVKTTFFIKTYYWFVHAGFRTITMWGANMAIRRSAWLEVADSVCNDDSIVHEDQDVSLWIASKGGKIKQVNDLIITTSGQSYRYFPKFNHYAKLFSSTKSLHDKNGNLDKVKYKLGFWQTMPGRLVSYFIGALMFIFVTIMFPIDYLISKSLRNKEWLER